MVGTAVVVEDGAAADVVLATEGLMMAVADDVGVIVVAGRAFDDDGNEAIVLDTPKTDEALVTDDVATSDEAEMIDVGVGVEVESAATLAVDLVAATIPERSLPPASEVGASQVLYTAAYSTSIMLAYPATVAEFGSPGPEEREKCQYLHTTSHRKGWA